MGINMNALKDKRARAGGGWTPTEGDNPVRILPPSQKYFTEDLDDFALEYRIHFFKQEGYDTEVSRCLRDQKEHCPVCEMVGRFRRSAVDPVLAQVAEDIRSGERHLMNLIDLRDPQTGIQIYDAGYTVYHGIIGFCTPAWGDLFNPAQGRSLHINLTPAQKSRTGFNSYSVQPDPQITDASGLLPEGWMEKLDELSDNLPGYKSEEELKAILRRYGFPVNGIPAAGPVAQAPVPATPAPAPAATPTPLPAPTPVPVPTPVAVAAEVTPTPVPVPVAPAPVAVVAPVVAPVAAVGSDRPAGCAAPAVTATEQPVCFGGYDPAAHPCDPCLAKSACQVRMLDI